MTSLYRLLALISLVSLISVSTGCGSSGSSAASTAPPIELVFTQKGKPLGYVEVTLVEVGGSADNARVAQADAKGTAVVESVPAGEYQVRVARMMAAGPDPAFEKYGEATPLTATVTESERKFTFEL